MRVRAFAFLSGCTVVTSVGTALRRAPKGRLVPGRRHRADARPDPPARLGGGLGAPPTADHPAASQQTEVATRPGSARPGPPGCPGSTGSHSGRPGQASSSQGKSVQSNGAASSSRPASSHHDFGKTGALIDQAKAGQRVASAQVVQTRQLVVQNVKVAYYNLLRPSGWSGWPRRASPAAEPPERPGLLRRGHQASRTSPTPRCRLPTRGSPSSRRATWSLWRRRR